MGFCSRLGTGVPDIIGRPWTYFTTLYARYLTRVAVLLFNTF